MKNPLPPVLLLPVFTCWASSLCLLCRVFICYNWLPPLHPHRNRWENTLLFLSLMRFDSCCYFSSGGGCCAHKSSGASRSSNSYCCEYFSCACPLWIRHEMCVDLKCVGWYVSTSSNCTKMKLKYLKYKRCHLVLETWVRDWTVVVRQWRSCKSWRFSPFYGTKRLIKKLEQTSAEIFLFSCTNVIEVK